MRACTLVSALVVVLASCQRPVPPTMGDRSRARAPAVEEPSPSGDEAANLPEIVDRIAPTATAAPTNKAHRWLKVESARQGAEDGWATGAFDAVRNKIIIRLRDVDRFLVRVDRIPIDWRRVVILSINGRNSELRKRDFSPYHFQRDPFGRWVVVEPK